MEQWIVLLGGAQVGPYAPEPVQGAQPRPGDVGRVVPEKTAVQSRQVCQKNAADNQEGNEEGMIGAVAGRGLSRFAGLRSLSLELKRQGLPPECGQPLSTNLLLLLDVGYQVSRATSWPLRVVGMAPPV